MTMDALAYTWFCLCVLFAFSRFVTTIFVDGELVVFIFIFIVLFYGLSAGNRTGKHIFYLIKHILIEMLKIERRKYYQVKKGQNLREIAEYFSVSEWLIAKENALLTEPRAGSILKIPDEAGNAYIVQAGDTKTLLCGNEENYRRKNGTDIFYIGMRVIL